MWHDYRGILGIKYLRVMSFFVVFVALVAGIPILFSKSTTLSGEDTED